MSIVDSKSQLEKIVKEVLNENYSNGGEYSAYPYNVEMGEENEPAEDYIQDWKALELEIMQDKSRGTAIEISKILINDLELFNDVLDIVGKNQSLGAEILRNLEEIRKKEIKTNEND